MVKNNEIKKEFMEAFREMCRCRSDWQVWADLITAIACTLANSVDKKSSAYAKREEEYKACMERLGSFENTTKCLSCIVRALDTNPEQDFLGAIYMEMNLGNHWKGQFFTPYNLCQLMSEITIDNKTVEKVDQKGYVAFHDSACGAGATLVASANTSKKLGVNFQQHILFVGQDIDRIVGMMCFIQLSLLGCPGYVCVANSLTNPLIGDALYPQEQEGQEFWYTPMWYSDIWVGRRIWHKLDGKTVKKQEEEVVKLPDSKYFIFNFESEE